MTIWDRLRVRSKTTADKTSDGRRRGLRCLRRFAHPGCLESVLASRNVQPVELPEIAEAWGNVRVVVIHEPRLSKKGVQLEKLKVAAPEMFTDFPILLSLMMRNSLSNEQ